MAAVSLSGGVWVPDVSYIGGGWLLNGVDLTVDAANEAVHLIGTCTLEGKSGSKTISSSGGKIHIPIGASTTFSNGGTTLRVGIQDVDAANGPPARGDGTFDVFKDLVGGTDTLTSNAVKSVTMASGTKTINNGDPICVAITMTARGGADSVKISNPQPAAVQVATINEHLPQVILVTAGPTYTGQSAVPNVVIEFDDGTIGWIEGGLVNATISGSTLYNTTSFDSGTSPDEYAMVFRFPGPVTIDAVTFIANPEGSANSTFEVIIYSGAGLAETPVALATITVDPNQNTGNNTHRRYFLTLPTALDLTANAWYALAIRPTTTNNVSIFTFDVAAAAHWKAHALGTDCFLGGRTNQSGAFGQTTTSRMIAGVRVSKISDGSGGGSASYARSRVVNAGAI